MHPHPNRSLPSYSLILVKFFHKLALIFLFHTILQVLIGCNNGGGGGILLKVKQCVRNCISTLKQFFSVFSCFWLFHCWFWKRKNFSPKLIEPIKPRMRICPFSRTVEISTKIWIMTYFEPVTVDSEDVFRHFAFWRHGSRLSTFFIAPKTAFYEAHVLSS